MISSILGIMYFLGVLVEFLAREPLRKDILGGRPTTDLGRAVSALFWPVWLVYIYVTYKATDIKIWWRTRRNKWK